MKLVTPFGWVAAGTLLIGAVLPGIVKAGQKERNIAPQHFVCNVGYNLEECKKQLAVLRAIVEKYPTNALGEWTWVMVKSEDWKKMLPKFGLNSYSPAFTCLETKATFIEEALVVQVPERTRELVAKWQMGRDSLLDFAVAHEIGHGMCSSLSEDEANHIVEMLRRNVAPSCQADF
jgi:hypothetical protein